MKEEPSTQSQPPTMSINHGEAKGTYEVHPVACVFPLLTGIPFEDLKQSIKQDGQQDPIVFDENVLLDGRNRLLIVNDLGLVPKVIQFSELQTNLSPGDWIVLKNLQRRHLTDDQRLAIAADYQVWLRKNEQAMRSSPAVGRKMDVMVGADETDAKRSRTVENLGNSEYPPKAAENTNNRRRGRPRGTRSDAIAVAASTKQSRHKAEKMLKLKKQNPELARSVKEGQVTLKHAATQSKRVQQPKRPKNKPIAESDEIKNAVQRADSYLKRESVKLLEEQRGAFWQRIASLTITRAESEDQKQKKEPVQGESETISR